MTSQPSAKVILDSTVHQQFNESRVITVEGVIHRFVLSELNTHRCFSRNSASSRAIPFAKILERVRNDPAVPISFPREQKGMQGGEELDAERRRDAISDWHSAKAVACAHAEMMASRGVHKSVVNRLLEPFMWHTVIITATWAGWQSFFDLRCSPLAQPEIRVFAEAAREAINNSTPQRLHLGQWHLPYVTGIDDAQLVRWAVDQNLTNPWMITDVLKKVSAARCARVSYLTHEGHRDIGKDFELAGRLANPGEESPPHASPFEHVCTPRSQMDVNLGRYVPGNLAPYWRQYRHELFDA